MFAFYGTASAQDFISKFGAPGTGDGQFNSPSHVAIDAQGNIYITDSLNDRIQKFDPSGKFFLRIGSSGSDDGHLSGPSVIALDGD